MINKADFTLLYTFALVTILLVVWGYFKVQTGSENDHQVIEMSDKS